MKLVRTVEGETTLFVPEESLTSEAPPTSPVFFNPLASTNRNVSVAVTAASGGSSFCDALAGIGARGVRVAKEAMRDGEVAVVDFNRESLKVAKRNARANGVLGRTDFVESEACAYLDSRYGAERKFDFVDVDPFGTPVRFLQPALNAVTDGGVVSVTATDTAVLCGVHIDVCRRRYGSTPINNHFHHETAVRILVNALRRQAGALDLGIEPLVSHSTKHYIRVFARVRVGPSKAEASLKGEGFLTWCPKCNHAEKSERVEWSCPACGAKARSAGPLWVGGLADRKLANGALEEARKRGFKDAAKILASMGRVDDFPPWSYSIERVCSSLEIPSVPEEMVADVLGELGRSCSRQPFEKTGLKTDASYEEVVRAVGAAHRRRSGSQGGTGPSRGPRQTRR